MIYIDILGCNAIDLDLFTFSGDASEAIVARREGIIEELVPVMEYENHLGIHFEKVDFWGLAKIAEKTWPGNFRLKSQGNFDKRSFRNKVEGQMKEGCAFLRVYKLWAFAARSHIYGFFGEGER
jgi:hypothetical protein